MTVNLLPTNMDVLNEPYDIFEEEQYDRIDEELERATVISSRITIISEMRITCLVPRSSSLLFNNIKNRIKERVNINSPTEFSYIIDYSSKKHECSICLDEKDKDIFKTNCGHIFCSGCMERWLKTNINCPYCRSTVK